MKTVDYLHIGFVLTSLLIGVYPVSAQQGGAQIQFLPERIIGTVLYPDGQTPVSELPVRLWDVKQNRVLVRTQTDSQGRFQIPRQAEGDFVLFAGRLRLDLRLVGAAGPAVVQPHDMFMVLPRGMLVPGGRMYDVLLSPSLVGATLADSFGEGPTILPSVPANPPALPSVPADPPALPPVPPPIVPPPFKDPSVVSP